MSEEFAESVWVAGFDWERMQKPLYIRSRRPGDRFKPAGMGGTKKVKDFLIDAKVPGASRNHIGILASPDEIYWIVGMRRDERGKITNETHTRIKVEILQTP
jgi:tRNA(Ile)-lysidine synthase